VCDHRALTTDYSLMKFSAVTITVSVVIVVCIVTGVTIPGESTSGKWISLLLLLFL